MTFRDGNVVLGKAAVTTSNGTTTASLSLPQLGAGSHQIAASYEGDVYYASSSSQTLGLSVQRTTTSKVKASQASTLFGQSLTLTATVGVTSPGGGTPTGTVSFKDGSTVLGTGTLSASGGVTTATLVTAKLPVGARSLTAVYAGDGNDQGSTSAALAFKVSPDATTTALAASASSSVFGQPVTLKATVKVTSPGAGTPTGIVTFKDGSTVLGTGTLSASGGVTTATLVTAKLPVGARSLTAVYGGDIDDLASTSAALSLKVSPDATTTALAASPSVYGQAVTLTATVKVTSPGAGTPTGIVTFKDGSTVLGTGTLSASGGVTTATLVTAKLPVGARSLTAVYAGDGNDQGSTSAALSLKVSPDATATTLVASPSPSVFGQPVTLKAIVKVTSPVAGTPTGIVTFKDGSTVLGTGTLSASGGVTTATLVTAKLPVAPAR